MDKTKFSVYGDDYRPLDVLESLIADIKHPELHDFVDELHFRISGVLVRDVNYDVNDVAELIIQTLDSKQRQKIN